MKANQITFVNVAFNATKDYQLQRLAVTDWKQERSISGITRYIVKNFDNSKPLNELLLRKGYKKADFGTMTEPNFSFVLSHMSDKAKFQQIRVKAIAEGEKDTLSIKVDQAGAKVAKLTYQLGSVLTELRKIENVAIEPTK